MQGSRTKLLLAACGSLWFCTACQAAGNLKVLLDNIPVAPANASGFATRLAFHNDRVYTANVEPGPGESRGPVNLLTVVRQGRRASEGGGWQWSARLLDEHTLDDPYHTEPSIGVDQKGHVHVAYNMHNMPWQYAVSKRPGDISKFDFRGEYVSPARRIRVQEHNETHFFDRVDKAAIPGTQVTYPRFFNDKQGGLMLTYRYALRPARKWSERQLSGSIVRYDMATRRWQQLGGPVELTADDARLPLGRSPFISRPFASEPGWVVYMIDLAFDAFGGMHVAWLWREGDPGRTSVQPSYAFSPDGGKSFFRSDGEPYELPIGREAAEKIVADADQRFLVPLQLSVTPAGLPLVFLRPEGEDEDGRLIRGDGQGGWLPAQTLPDSTRTVRVDKRGVSWAFVSGLALYRLDDDGWKKAASMRGYCKPWPLETPDGFLLHVEHCDDASRAAILRYSRS